MGSTFETSKKLYQVNRNTVRYQGCIEPRVFIVAKWIGSGKKVLDAGCYDGLLSEIFLKNGNQVYGFDASKDAVNRAKKRGIVALVADAEKKFPFPDRQFDLIHAGEIIEHLYDTDIFISECRRVLKKNGKIIITTPNTLSLPRRIMYFLGIGKFFEASNSFSSEGIGVGHIRFFTKKLLVDYLKSRGFKLKKFTSDFINLPFGYKTIFFAKLLPTMGKTLIAQFEKIK